MSDTRYPMGILEEYQSNGYFRIHEDRIHYSPNKSYQLNDPEEKARALVYGRLINEYKYSQISMDTEVTAPERARRNLPADIVVFEDDTLSKAYIVVEVKAELNTEEDIHAAVRQGLGYANLLNAKYLLVASVDQWIAFDATKGLSNVDAFMNERIADIPIRYGKVPSYRFVKDPDSPHKLAKADFTTLDRTFQKCHKLIWDGGRLDPARAFDAFNKLLVAKIQDERYTKTGEHYDFQVGTDESAEEVGIRICKLFEEVRSRDPDIFGTEIDLPHAILFRIAKYLQHISLRDTDLDVKGRAFEGFLGKHFRGEHGQYFTPRQVVEFMVSLIDPDENELLIDPACGSGGFLLYSMKHVIDKISTMYKDDNESITRISYDYSHKHVFGIDVNDRIARVAVMDMVVHEDGHTNIGCFDTLEDYDVIRQNQPEFGFGSEKYGVLLTNPPFGNRIKRGDVPYFGKYEMSYKTNGESHTSQMSEILFLERTIQLVKEGGIIGIVLPDSAFTNLRNIPVVEFLKKHCIVHAVISLPLATFAPYGAETTKTSILYLERRKNENDNSWIFMAEVAHVGYDANGRADKNDLPSVLKEWEKYKEDPPAYPQFQHVGQASSISKVHTSQIKSKMDVAAYGERYHQFMKEIRSINPGLVVPLLDICVDIYNGIGPKAEDYVDIPDMGTPVLKTATVKKISDRHGIIDWEGVNYVSKNKFKKSIPLNQNDILVQSVAHIRKYIGDKVSLVENIPPDFHKVLALNKFLIVRPDVEKVNPKYLALYLASNHAQIQYDHYVRGMSAQIYKEDIQHLLVKLPSMAEQERIATKYDNLISERVGLVSKLDKIKNSMDGIMGQIQQNI